MSRTIIEIARHELAVLVKTRRIVAIAGVYLGFALLGGLGTVVAAKKMEEGAIQLLLSQGMASNDAAIQVERMGEPAFQKMTNFFAGTELNEMAPALQLSPILPIFLWASLAFLPIMILLTSFEQTTVDLNVRTLCYSTLRASRSGIILGKALASGIVFVALTFFSAALLVILAATFLDSLDVMGNALGMLRICSCLVPFGACYVGITAFASASNTQPVGALLSALGMMFGLRALGWLSAIPEDHPMSALQFLHWLSPATHHPGLWQAGLAAPLASALAYAIFAALFLWAAVWRLRARDL